MNEEYDIIDTAREAGNFTMFIEALEKARLKETLRHEGPYTIFAPTDQAFAKLPHGQFDQPEKNHELESLLRRHIVLGKLLAADLENLQQTQSAEGEVLKIESRNGLWVNEAKILWPDLEAANGVIHGIDTVLMPDTKAAVAGKQ